MNSNNYDARRALFTLLCFTPPVTMLAVMISWGLAMLDPEWHSLSEFRRAFVANLRTVLEIAGGVWYALAISAAVFHCGSWLRGRLTKKSNHAKT